MSMNIKELEKIRTLFFDQTIQLEEDQQGMIFSMIDWFMETVIDTFKEFEKEQDKIKRQADDNWRVIQYHTDYMISNYRKINKLTVKLNKLEELNEPEENIKVGGTD